MDFVDCSGLIYAPVSFRIARKPEKEFHVVTRKTRRACDCRGFYNGAAEPCFGAGTARGPGPTPAATSGRSRAQRVCRSPWSGGWPASGSRGRASGWPGGRRYWTHGSRIAAATLNASTSHPSSIRRAGPIGAGPSAPCCSCAEARLGSTIVKTAAIASAPSLARDNMSGWPGGRRHWTTVHGDSKRDWCIYQTAAIYEIHRNAKPQRTACAWVSNSTHARRIREERCERLLRSYPALRRIHDAS